MHRTCRCLVLILVSLFAFACKGGAPVVASVKIEGATGASVGFVKYDGDLLLARGEVELTAELYFKGSGEPVLLPAGVEAGKQIAVSKSAKIKLEAPAGTPIPAIFASLFKPGEAAALGVTFE